MIAIREAWRRDIASNFTRWRKKKKGEGRERDPSFLMPEMRSYVGRQLYGDSDQEEEEERDHYDHDAIERESPPFLLSPLLCCYSCAQTSGGRKEQEGCE